ncbi:MAG: hypothetical protein EPO22_04535 [Dehalococcoidia bacterium]|nr:MAG: hypothetical protein EPO22_04535 [Dehalococcoidia bacterium]
MQKRRTRSDGSSKTILIGIVACSALILALAVGFELLARGGGDSSDQPEAAVTNAPDDHPAAATTGGPDLHFSTTSIDLGLVPLGKDVGYSFSYANVGAKPLRIGDVNVRAVKGC